MGVKFTSALFSMVRHFRMAATLVLLIWRELRSKPATFDTLVAARGKRPSSLAQVFVLKRQFLGRLCGTIFQAQEAQACRSEETEQHHSRRLWNAGRRRIHKERDCTYASQSCRICDRRDRVAGSD